MQWTDESGRAYGEDPYGGVGYAYGYGYEYNGTTTDTATMPAAPGQLEQGTYPTGNAYAATDPYATGTHLYVIATDPYAAGPAPVTTAWESPQGDVLTVPPAELDPSGPPAPGPDTTKSESVRPVFVDSSGRRQRRVMRAARLLVIPAGGYVALLISTVLGGPSLSAPFVPQPDSTHPAKPHASAPDSSPGVGHSLERESTAAAQKNSRPTAVQKTSGSTGRSTASATSSAAPATVSTAALTATASPTSAPTATPTPDPSSKGRALGTSHKPAK